MVRNSNKFYEPRIHPFCHVFTWELGPWKAVFSILVKERVLESNWNRKDVRKDGSISTSNLLSTCQTDLFAYCIGKTPLCEVSGIEMGSSGPLGSQAPILGDL